MTDFDEASGVACLQKQIFDASEMQSMSDHVNDRVSLVLHRLIAKKVAVRPDLLSHVEVQLDEEGDDHPGYLEEWNDLLAQGAQAVCRKIGERSAAMYRLRLCSPLLKLVVGSNEELRARAHAEEMLSPLFVVEFEGEEWLPVLQFEGENRLVLPAIRTILEIKPDRWSSFRLLDWLMRPHVEFQGSPASVLGDRGEEVVAAFRRSIEPPRHG